MIQRGSSAVRLHPAGGRGGSPLAVTVNVSYPVADLLLVVVLLAGLAPSRSTWPRTSSRWTG